jgi:hypothetical protein
MAEAQIPTYRDVAELEWVPLSKPTGEILWREWPDHKLQGLAKNVLAYACDGLFGESTTVIHYLEDYIEDPSDVTVARQLIKVCHDCFQDTLNTLKLVPSFDAESEDLGWILEFMQLLGSKRLRCKYSHRNCNFLVRDQVLVLHDGQQAKLTETEATIAKEFMYARHVDLPRMLSLTGGSVRPNGHAEGIGNLRTSCSRLNKELRPLGFNLSVKAGNGGSGVFLMPYNPADGQ